MVSARGMTGSGVRPPHSYRMEQSYLPEGVLLTVIRFSFHQAWGRRWKTALTIPALVMRMPSRVV